MAYIAPKLYDSPEQGYQEIAATLAPGQRAIIEFDYATTENPDATAYEYLEVMYPNATVLGADGDISSPEIYQGALGACGHFSQIACYASSTNEYRLETGIYPTEVSPISLYLLRIQDPNNPLGVKWVATDSRMPCKPGGKSNFIGLPASGALAPMLAIKAESQAKGGSFNEVTNHEVFKRNFNWFPSVTKTVKSFEEMAIAIERGAVCLFSMTQQKDPVTGADITPSGVVYDHGYGLVGTLTANDLEGMPVKLVRLSNPWPGGSDFESSYSDNAPFWDQSPELSAKRDETRAFGGEYWVSWNCFCQLTGKTEFEVKVPLPQPEYPNVATLTYTFDETTAIASNLLSSLWPLAATRKDYIAVTVTEPTEIQIEQSWKSGTGNRHAMLKIQNVAKTFTFVTPTGYWGSVKNNTVSFPSAGTYYIFPNTTNMMVDRGELQLIFQSAKAFELKRLEAIA